MACVMLKLDPTLRDKRERFVPNLVEEEDFWRCYFYECEAAKKEAGLPHKLGGPRAQISEEPAQKEAVQTTVEEPLVEADATHEETVEVAESEKQA